MKAIISFTALMFVSAAVSAAPVSEDRWKSFCQSQTNQDVMSSCVRVDLVCENAGFKSERCEKARRSVMSKPAHPGKLKK